MPQFAMPALNQAYIDTNTTWNETDIRRYHRLPYWMAKIQDKKMNQDAPVFGPLLGDIKWQPNSGDTGSAIMKTRAPYLRQSFNPSRLSALPKVDTYLPGERQTKFYLYWHMHETPPMRFYEAFTDFFDHTEDLAETIADQQARDSELFYRHYMFQQSPAVFLPNRGGTSALSSIGNEVVITTGALQGNGDDDWSTNKSLGWLASTLPGVGQPGNLSIQAVDLACTYMEQQRMRPYSGSGSPMGDDMGIDSTYLLLCSPEAFGAFRYDPWLRANKNITLDIVYNKKFKGNFMGRWTTRIEHFPLRFKISTTGAITVPAPETIVMDASAENFGEPVPNDDYNNAEYEVAWLISGEEHYKKVRVGPPPSAFRNNGAPKGFGSLKWNGEIELTPHFLIEALDSNGNLKQMLNTNGMWIKARATTVYGVAGTQKRGVLPIIFKRVLGARNPVN